MTWVWDNLDLIGRLSLEHVRLSIPPIVLGLILAVPIGWLAYRYRRARPAILTVIGLLYTIPSLALFVILPVVLGVGFLSEVNVTVALTIYAVAILVRSVADALGSVDAEVRQAATAMGYSGWSRFWVVELPLAGPVVLAGLRVAAVSTVSLVTVGIFVGVESLGYLFINGLQRRILAEVASGLVMTVVIALVIDLLLVLLGRALMPWTRVDSRRRRLMPTPEVVGR
ncbi:ABC transporter permease [Microbacteriaceae bacterium 4G12]